VFFALRLSCEPCGTAASQQQRGKSDQIHHPDLPDPVADHCSSIWVEKYATCGNFIRQREGIQLLSRPSFVERYYEYLLLLPFCGDCQGFSPHLGA
jgi:hypothetical protein